MIEHLFVYGTLLRGANHAMHRVLAEGAAFVGEGWINGRVYRVAHYPGAVLSDAADERVFGEVYRLRSPADALAALDDYEGCGPGSRPPTEFVRVLLRVARDHGGDLDAWVYLYNRPVNGLERILSGRFLAPAEGAGTE